MGSIAQNAGLAGPDVEAFVGQEYDYIICGGGTAGLVLAARLSENPNVTVGVIEAGKNRLDDAFVDTPALFPQMMGNPEYDFMYRTTKQLIMYHEGNSWVARVELYVRGSDADYDDWAALTNDDIWSSKVMKKYMRKHQTLDPIDESVKNRSTMPFVGENHGTKGPIHTSFNPWKLDIEDDVVKAADEVTGYVKKPMDPFSGDHIGFYHTLAAISRADDSTKGKRSYAARGYYEPIAHRSNLRIVTESFVTKILLNDSNDTAVGAVFSNNNANYTVKAKREVIVCAGAIASPQILELSGIGDPKILTAAGVDCKIPNSSVGANFQDHVVIVAIHELSPGRNSLDMIQQQPSILESALQSLNEKQTGPLTCASTVQGFFPYMLFSTPEQQATTVASIEATPNTTEFTRNQYKTVLTHLRSDKSANLQMVLVAAHPDIVNGVQDQSKLFIKPNASPDAKQCITLACCLQYPASRGTCHISSSDPTTHPTIDPGYLTHEADITVLAAGMSFLNRLAQSNALKDHLGARLHPNPHTRDLNTFEGCKAAVLDWYMGEYHVCGSVAMGDALDSRLRVKIKPSAHHDSHIKTRTDAGNGVVNGNKPDGTDQIVKNLRVIDASCFPGNVSGNIMSSVYALAERAADLIKEDWNEL